LESFLSFSKKIHFYVVFVTFLAKKSILPGKVLTFFRIYGAIFGLFSVLRLILELLDAFGEHFLSLFAAIPIT